MRKTIEGKKENNLIGRKNDMENKNGKKSRKAKRKQKGPLVQ